MSRFIPIQLFIPILIFLASLDLNAQKVSIPDADFKSYLVSNMAINTNND